MTRRIVLLVVCALLALACEQSAQPDVDRVAALERRVADLEEKVEAVDRATAASLPAGKDASVEAVLLAIRERRDPRALPDGQKVTFCLVSGWMYGDLELLRLHIDLEQVLRAQALAQIGDGDDRTYGRLLETEVGPRLRAAGDRLTRIRALLESGGWTRSREVVRERVE